MAASSEYKKAVAKRISQLIISNYDEVVATTSTPSLKSHQKTIARGKPRTGRTSTETLLIYGNELQSQFEDSTIINNIAEKLWVLNSDIWYIEQESTIILITPDSDPRIQFNNGSNNENIPI